MELNLKCSDFILRKKIKIFFMIKDFKLRIHPLTPDFVSSSRKILWRHKNHDYA